MTGANCVATIERNLKRLAGVEIAVVNLSSERATVEYDPLQLGLADLIAGVHRGWSPGHLPCFPAARSWCGRPSVAPLSPKPVTWSPAVFSGGTFLVR